METIKINKSDLTASVANLLGYAGSTEWALYVDKSGSVNVRHNTFNSRGWFNLIDAYGMENYENDGKYPGDDGYNYQTAAEWIVNEESWIPGEITYSDIDDGEYVEHVVQIEIVN